MGELKHWKLLCLHITIIWAIQATWWSVAHDLVHIYNTRSCLGLFLTPKDLDQVIPYRRITGIDTLWEWRSGISTVKVNKQLHNFKQPACDQGVPRLAQAVKAHDSFQNGEGSQKEVQRIRSGSNRGLKLTNQVPSDFVIWEPIGKSNAGTEHEEIHRYLSVYQTPDISAASVSVVMMDSTLIGWISKWRYIRWESLQRKENPSDFKIAKSSCLNTGWA